MMPFDYLKLDVVFILKILSIVVGSVGGVSGGSGRGGVSGNIFDYRYKKTNYIVEGGYLVTLITLIKDKLYCAMLQYQIIFRTSFKQVKKLCY